MDRRHFLALLSTPALVALLQACGSDESTSPTTSDPATDPSTSTTPARSSTGEARSGLARVDAPADQAAGAALAFNDFGDVLYRALAAADPTGNLVLSPTSVALALTMTAAGARGETLEQMLATLQVGDADGIHRATNALTAQLE